MADEIIKYAPLGGKTLFVLIWKRSAIILLPLILLIIIIAALPYLPAVYGGYAGLGIVAVVAILVIIALIVILVGWLQYARYKIFIDAESIKINRGIIKEEQIGIPFRRIKEAAIERSIFDQFVGISNLVLTILGEDEGKVFSKESRITLPALDQKIAQAIQDVVLKRSDVEEMNIQAK